MAQETNFGSPPIIALQAIPMEKRTFSNCLETIRQLHTSGLKHYVF